MFAALIAILLMSVAYVVADSRKDKALEENAERLEKINETAVDDEDWNKQRQDELKRIFGTALLSVLVFVAVIAVILLAYAEVGL